MKGIERVANVLRPADDAGIRAAGRTCPTRYRTCDRIALAALFDSIARCCSGHLAKSVLAPPSAPMRRDRARCSRRSGRSGAEFPGWRSPRCPAVSGPIDRTSQHVHPDAAGRRRNERPRHEAHIPAGCRASSHPRRRHLATNQRPLARTLAVCTSPRSV